MLDPHVLILTSDEKIVVDEELLLQRHGVGTTTTLAMESKRYETTPAHLRYTANLTFLF
jgi:hypothetical protein